MLFQAYCAWPYQADGITDAGSVLVAGFRPFRAANPKLVTNEQIDQLRDQDGL